MSVPRLRVRRVSTVEELEACLAVDEPLLLPLCFADADAGEVASTVDPGLARLAPNHEQTYEFLGVELGLHHLVLVTAHGLAGDLASRYATITGRKQIRGTDLLMCGLQILNLSPSSLTWFSSLDESDIAEALHHLQDAFTLGPMPPMGVLTAESPERLTWLMAKQLVPQSEANGSTTVISSEPVSQRRPWASLACVGSDDTMVHAITTIHQATGTILINGHSRPHCGLLPASDGIVGICGLASGGAGGRCVEGTTCQFGEAPRVVLQRLRARRVFFNGCTTAGVGTRRPDYLPSAAMLVHAALRGTVREYVGNVRTGLYGEEDLDWFMGSSALGFSPAECIVIVEAARKASERELIPSLLYFGDATNPPWPVTGVVVGDVLPVDANLSADQVTTSQVSRVAIRWHRLDRVLVARVPSVVWAELAAQDCLHVLTQHPSHPLVNVLADPWSDASLVLAVPQVPIPPSDEPERCSKLENSIVIELRILPEKIDRNVGHVLSASIEHLRVLEDLPTFTPVVADVPSRLEQELVVLRRAAGSRSSLTLLPELLQHVRDLEAQAARTLDDALVSAALARSTQRWNWSAEYLHRVRAVPSQERRKCPGCGAISVHIEYLDYVYPRLIRCVELCGYCGVVVDHPAWPLRLRWVIDTLRLTPNAFEGRVEVYNEDIRPRKVTLGVTVRGAGQMHPQSRAKAQLEVMSDSTECFDFSLLPEAPMTKLMQAWTFMACEGSIGLIGRMLLFGRDHS